MVQESRGRTKSERVSEFVAEELQDPIRVVLVGLGRAGGFHMQSIRLLGPRIARLAYVVDVNSKRAEEVAAEFACRASTSLEEVSDLCCSRCS